MSNSNISTMPAKTGDEILRIFVAIDKLREMYDPAIILMLQTEAIIRHYNLNRDAREEPKTISDLLPTMRMPSLNEVE